MATNKRLTEDEREAAKEILAKVRAEIERASGGKKDLAWAIRRYIYIRLQHDERGTPIRRKMLKLKKAAAQKGKCARCGDDLPERGANLHRLDAMEGYTDDNTELVCPKCHREQQAERGFH